MRFLIIKDYELLSNNEAIINMEMINRVIFPNASSGFTEIIMNDGKQIFTGLIKTQKDFKEHLLDI